MDDDVERPGVPCLRCGQATEAGFVGASAGRYASSLGWVAGEWKPWRRMKILLDDRFFGRARVPGYRCPACGLIFLTSAS